MRQIEPLVSEKIPGEPGDALAGDHAAESVRRAHPRQWWWGVAVLLLLVAVGWVRYEARTSRLQAWAGARYAEPLAFAVAPGPSDRIRFPAHGPFDERLGYTRLPAFVASLQSSGFEITAQARHSDALLAHQDRGLYAPYA